MEPVDSIIEQHKGMLFALGVTSVSYNFKMARWTIRYPNPSKRYSYDSANKQVSANTLPEAINKLAETSKKQIMERIARLRKKAEEAERMALEAKEQAKAAEAAAKLFEGEEEGDE